jgi:two-component system sensor histidine kinase TctE
MQTRIEQSRFERVASKAPLARPTGRSQEVTTVHLLLIEDHPELSLWLGRALRQAGYEVTFALDGEEGDNLLRNGGFDLVVLDLNLPKRSGLEILASLRARADTTPVLILTARAEVSDRVHGLNAGADDYLPKPFELTEFEARVHALLRRPKDLRQEMRTLGRLTLDLKQNAFYRDGDPVQLSKRENALLRALFDREGRAVSKEFLLEEVFSGGTSLGCGGSARVPRAQAGGGTAASGSAPCAAWATCSSDRHEDHGRFAARNAAAVVVDPHDDSAAAERVVHLPRGRGCRQRSLRPLFAAVGAHDCRSHAGRAGPPEGGAALRDDGHGRRRPRRAPVLPHRRRQPLLAGYADLPGPPDKLPMSTAYPALVHFYDVVYQGQQLRAAAFYQPINEQGLTGMAVVHVAETFATRDALTERILIDTLLRQALLIGCSIVLILVGISRGLRPIDRLRDNLEARGIQDLTPLDESAVPAETRPFVGALNRYIGRLAELVELRKRFIANAAHQLRTPIAVLKTQIGIARRETDLQSLHSIVQAMDSTTDTAARLANQLLSLTRAEHGVAASGQDVDMVALARNVCLDLSPRAVEAGIDLGFDAAASDPSVVRGDPMLLHEMLVNLIDNAIKYAGRGERVTVRVSAGDGLCTLIVEDSGPGIAAQERAQVKRRFYRVPGQSVPGSGLGLAIVDEIVTQHAGRFELDEAEIGGLRVRIRLPLRLPARRED